VHFSAQSDHVHLLVEASDRDTLIRGVWGLAVRIARAVNRALGRKGTVWGDRYHVRALRTPREVRSALLYVLQNFRKHGRGPGTIDPCSSANWFDGFLDRSPDAHGRARVVRPRTWLLRVGWRRWGLLSVREGPASSRKFTRS